MAVFNILQQIAVIIFQMFFIMTKKAEDRFAVLLIIHADRIGGLLEISVIFSGRHAGLHWNLLKDQLCIQLCDILVFSCHGNAFCGKAFAAQQHSIGECFFISSDQPLVMADFAFYFGCECHSCDLLKSCFHFFLKLYSSTMLQHLF